MSTHVRSSMNRNEKNSTFLNAGEGSLLLYVQNQI